MTVATISGRTESHTIPIGTILPWPHSSTAPSGWLMCDGSAVSTTTYAELYSIITNKGTTFPFGANVGSTFLLPNLNGGGYMPRSPSTTTPPSGATSNVGSTVAATNHNHTWDIGAALTGSTDGGHTHSGAALNCGGVTLNAHSVTSTIGSTNANATGTNAGGSGTQGTALRVHGHSATAVSYAGNHGSHTHGVDGNGNYSTAISTTHSHSWTTSGNSYSPTAISSEVANLNSRYIIFAKPVLGGVI